MSPFNLLQEQQLGKPYEAWRILVVCALLNRTHGRQVRPIVDSIFERWGNPVSMTLGWQRNDPELVAVLRPLGLYNRRIRHLGMLSQAYAERMIDCDNEDVRRMASARWAIGLPGVGQYALDSLEIFVYGRTDRVSSDTWLNKYLEWRNSNEPSISDGSASARAGEP